MKKIYKYPKKWRDAHKEKQAAWVRFHIDQYRQQQEEWRYNHPGYFAKYLRRWRLLHNKVLGTLMTERIAAAKSDDELIALLNGEIKRLKLR